MCHGITAVSLFLLLITDIEASNQNRIHNLAYNTIPLIHLCKFVYEILKLIPAWLYKEGP
jgi:hypothetical protein